MLTKSEQIQNRINELTTAINAGDSDVQLTLWEMERTEKIKELALALEEEANQQERVQAQTEKVESITLPLDFNDLLDNPLANEMIIEVVKQFQLQAYDEHNAEVVRINAEWIDKLNSGNAVKDALIEQLSGLHQDIQSLTNDLEGEKSMYGELEANYAHIQTLLNQANMDKADAETKRDNAVKELAQVNIEYQHKEGIENELKAQIEAMQQELTAKKALTVNGNDKLADLAKQAKESTIEKANRGLARWNLPAIEVPSMPAAETAEPLAMPEIPAAQEEHTFPQDNTNTDVHSGGIAPTEGNTPVHELVQQAVEETTLTLDSLKAEIDALKTAHETTVTRVDNIERHANIQAVA